MRQADRMDEVVAAHAMLGLEMADNRLDDGAPDLPRSHRASSNSEGMDRRNVGTLWNDGRDYWQSVFRFEETVKQPTATELFAQHPPATIDDVYANLSDRDIAAIKASEAKEG